MSSDEEVSGKAKGGVARARKLSPERKAEIAKNAAAARWMQPRTLSQPAPPNYNQNNGLTSPSLSQPASRRQLPLDLGVQIEKDINGIEMGVLENGIPYLTQKGLAEICGVQRSVIYDIAKDWEKNLENDVFGKDRNSFIKQYLFQHGYAESQLYIDIKDGTNSHHSYPDIVCMAVLEYYAFESKSTNQKAVDSYRRFAAYGLRKFIYDALAYTPGDKWKYHHDRVSLLKDSAPAGYFTIFQEVTGLIVDLITADLTVNDKTIPDISVGIAWAKFWAERDLAHQYGNRIPYQHNYPSYYPQSASNPQSPNAYPDTALPAFRQWFRQVYLLTKFPKYILSKANMLPGGKEEVLKIASMYHATQLPSPK